MVKKIDFHIHTVSSNKDYEFTYSSDWIQNYEFIYKFVCS